MIEDIVGILNFENNNNQSGGSKTKNHSKFQKTILQFYKNKIMNTLLIPLPTSNTITVGIFIKAGSRNETEAFGIAHFLEHMTFKGTTKFSSEKLMIKLDSIGANYNAMTAHEFTLYYISGDPRDIDEIISVIIDLYLNPTYPEEDIKKERNVVLEELRMNEDNNQRQLNNAVYKNIFGGIDDTLARPIIGYETTVSNLTRQDIINFKNKNYIPKNCLLCVSGNFDTNSVIETIENLFKSKLKLYNLSDNLFYDKLTDNINVQQITQLNTKTKRHINVKKNINQTVIHIVFNSFDTYNKNCIVTDLLCDILSNGFSSRLFNLLRNKLGISYYNSSFNRTFSDTGQMIINVGVDNNVVVNAIKEILMELKNMVENGVTEEELNKCKKQNETSLLFQFKDPYEYLMYYGLNMLTNKPLLSLSDMLSEIENVTLEQVKNVIKNIFTRDNIVIGTIGNVTKEQSNKIIKLIEEF